MEYSFSHFCFCSQTGYQTLKVFTDLCADAGRGYEFPECRLPYGCMPAVSTLGLGRKKGQYLLYFRPSVQYRGESKALAQFFRSSRLYPSFEDLCASLQALAGEFLPSKNGKASPAPAPRCPERRPGGPPGPASGYCRWCTAGPPRGWSSPRPHGPARPALISSSPFPFALVVSPV